MVSANFTPYNVPAGVYDGHLGELSTPTAMQNFGSAIDLARSSPVIAPTKAVGDYMERFKDQTRVTAEEANNQLTPYGVKPYDKDITQGELSQRLHQAARDSENTHAMEQYRINKNPSGAQQMLLNLGAGIVGSVADPIGFGAAILFPELLARSGAEVGIARSLEGMGVASRAVNVGSKVDFALGVGEAAKVGNIMGKLPLAQAVEVAGRSAFPRAIQYGIGAVEGASANVLTDVAFGKPMSDALHQDFSWEDVAAGAVMGAAIGSGALWGIPGDILRGVGDDIHARTPDSFVNKITKMTPEEIKRSVDDGIISRDVNGKPVTSEQLIKMREDFMNGDASARINEDLTPRMGGQRVTDIVEQLPYSQDTKASMITKAIQDLAENRGVNIDPITRLDLASKISTIFNKNINKGTILTEKLENGRYRAFIEGEQGALKDVKVERHNAQDAVDDLWALYKVNFTQSERVKAGLVKEIDSRMDALNLVSEKLKAGDKESALDILEDYLTKGRTKELNREINQIEINKAENFDLGAGPEAFSPEFNAQENLSVSKKAEFDELHTQARAEAEHILNDFDREYDLMQEYSEASQIADNLVKNGGMPVEELEKAIQDIKNPYGTEVEHLPMPDNSYETQVRKNNEHIVTLQEQLPKINSQLSSKKLGVNVAKLDYDMVNKRSFTEQVNRIDKITGNMPDIINNIHGIIDNLVNGVYDIIQTVGESIPMATRIGDELKLSLSEFNLHQNEVDFLSNKITTLLDTTTLVDMAAKRAEGVGAYRQSLISRIDESIAKLSANKEPLLEGEVATEIKSPELEKLEDMKKQLQDGVSDYQGIGMNQYMPLIADSLFEFENKLIHEKRTLLLQDYSIKERVLQTLTVLDAASNHLGEQANKSKIVMERLSSYIGGSINSFAKSRVSAESLQQIKSLKHSRLMKDITREGLIDTFRRADIEPEYRQNMFRDFLKPKWGQEVDNASETGRIANKVNQHFGTFIDDYNSAGGNITKMGAFLLPDTEKMRNYASIKFPERNAELNRMGAGQYSELSKAAFIDDYIGALDHESMFHEQGIMQQADKEAKLGSIFDSMVYGRSMNGELFTKRAPSLMDSKDLLKFASIDDELKFTLNMAPDSMEGSIKNSIDNLYNAYGLMSMFGPNPHAGLESIFQGIKTHFGSVKGNAYIATEMQGGSNGLKMEMANVDGTTSTPGRGIGATLGRVFRFGQTFNLGNVLVRSIGQDPLQQTAALSMAGGKKGVAGFVDTMRFNFEGFTDHGRALAESVGVGKDVFNISVANSFNQGEIYHTVAGMPWNKHTIDTHVNSVIKKTQDVYFSKVIFFNQYMEAMSRGTSLAWANHMAHMAEVPHNELGAENLTYLKEHGITEFEWNLVRDHAIKEEHTLLKQGGHEPTDGTQNRKFFVVDEIGNIPYQEFYDRYNEKFKENNGGKNLTPDRLEAMKRETQDKFDMMATDVVHSALTIPDARTMRYLNSGTQPGTRMGEGLRTIMQFKAFPIAQMRQNYGKIIGRGSDFGEFDIWKNILKGDGMVDAGGYAAAIIASNFAMQWATDVLQGKSPTDFTQKGNWIGPIADSGAAGPAGLLLFNSFKGDDSGRNWYTNVLRNVAGPALTNTAESIGRGVVKPLYRQGNAGDKMNDIGTHVAQEVVNNTPWHNALFWGIGFNALVGNHLNELLQPGYAYQKEQRLEERTGQTAGGATYDIWDPSNY